MEKVVSINYEAIDSTIMAIERRLEVIDNTVKEARAWLELLKKIREKRNE